MKKRLFNLVLSILLLFFFFSHGQQIKHLGAYDGIRSGAVRTFEKDTLGYMWIGTSQGLNRYSGYKFKNYNSQATINGVVDIISQNEHLFVLGAKGELLQYIYEQDTFSNILSLKGLSFLCFELVSDDTLIIGLQYGLLAYNFKTKEISKLQFPKSHFNRKINVRKNLIYVASTKGITVYDYLKETRQLKERDTLLNDTEVLDFNFDNQGRIWAGTSQEGVYVIENDIPKKLKNFDARLKTHTIRSIEFDKNNKALIALEGVGLVVVDSLFNVVNTLKYDPNTFNSLSQNSVYDVFVDEDNVYWLGLREVGIDLIYPKDNPFENISYIPYKQNSISNNNIRSIYFEENNVVWFGTENGISKLSSNGAWTNYNQNPLLSNKAVLTINKQADYFILSVYGVGLIQFDPKTGKTYDFSLIEKEEESTSIFATYIEDDELWIGGFDGPVKHFKNGSLVNSYVTGNARTIISGGENIMYVGSPNGLFKINTSTQQLTRIENDTFKNIDQIYSLLYDSENACIWIGNTQGLFKFIPETNEITSASKALNIESGTIFSIQKDTNQNLWLSGYKGLWKLSVKTGDLRKYDYGDGVSIETFGFGASKKASNGRLAFGGPKGATLFNPVSLPIEKEVAPIYISNFQVNGVDADATVIKKNINFLEKVTLNYAQNSFSIDFETPTYHGSKRHIFNWQLKGYDQAPIEAKNDRKIIYSNLPPGKYTLEIKAKNIAGLPSLNSFSIELTIKKPFWLSGWAILGYTIAGICLVILIIMIARTRADQKFNENKIMFFTEVAHDIRTPVSLIQLLVSQLSSDKSKLTENIKLIHRNTQNLNEYVTQLLDFQKADRKMLKLTVKQVKLNKIISRIVAEVNPLLHEKSIDLIIAIPKINLWFDESKMSRIFYNLISNAIKYSEEGGQIEINASRTKKTVKIDFIDNGFGIPEKEQKLIFSRFTRGTNINNKGIYGSGIGLMISKKIVELHGGEIELTSKENLGSTFSVILKLGSQHYDEKDLVIDEVDKSESEFIENSLNANKLVLLVEDNEDLRAIIKVELEKKYTVIDAPNGKEALVMALAKNPDLIITDVMMPVMDGKEFCRVIKTNFQTSHIPVIMITALGEIDDKIEGLEIGANAYLEKPFNMKLLHAMAGNLISSRRALNRVIDTKEQRPSSTKSPDENFLSEVVEIIQKNLNNRTFSIDLLSEKTGLSRSNLFRKLKGLTNMSPNDLVIKIKLNHAAELLKLNKTMRISDVAYESGFNDPRYFSTLFKKHFGKSPKEFSQDH